MIDADHPTAARASVTMWLGVLFVLVLILIAVGGYVRLSESGLSLAGWPMVGGRLLPPVTEAGWEEHFHLYIEELDRLKGLKEQGAVGIGVVPPAPESMQQFRTIYLTEFSHRLLAALVGLVGLACLVVLFRRRPLRHLAGGPLIGIVGLIIVQSVIGGILVLSGTSTHMLFVHLGTATAIVGLILWTMLLLLRGDNRPIDPTLFSKRRSSYRWALIALALVFIQTVLGALVAGSRQHGFSSTWPLMNGELVPILWSPARGLAWNLLDNAWLHQFVHRWFAWLVVLAILVMAAKAATAPIGARARLALRFVISSTFAQIALGILNVFSAVDTLVAMGHLMMALLLFSGLVLLVFDLRKEHDVADTESAPAGIPAGRTV